MSNDSISQVESRSFFQTWVDALSKPREETYAAIAASPRARAMTGYLWVFLTSIAASLVTLIIQGTTIRNRLAESGVAGEQLGNGFGGVVLTLLCGAPIVAVLGTIFFAIGAALVQWIARMFGGKGTNDQLAYTMAAIAAPYSVISSVLVLLSAIPYVGFCFNIVLALAGVYVLVLQIMAVKGVNQFGWGPAIGSFVLPGLAFGLVCCCAVAIVLTLSGAAIGSVWSTINQSLMP